jgi:alpha-ketoglutarate-dependent taurine dioxygenase
MKGLHMGKILLFHTRRSSRQITRSLVQTQGCGSRQISSGRQAASPADPRGATVISIRRAAAKDQSVEDRHLEGHGQATISNSADSSSVEVSSPQVFHEEAGMIEQSFASKTWEEVEEFLSREENDSLRGVDLVDVGHGPHFHPAYLRDACPCPRCINPSSRQKNFRTTDIPENIRASSVEHSDNGDIKITWENDIPGFGEDHISIFSKKFFEVHTNRRSYNEDIHNNLLVKTWGKRSITATLRFITYDQWIQDDAALRQGLLALNKLGLLIIRDVPASETAVEELAYKIGPIRDTFYGRTWDVKSVPKAKNVAYTHQYLGLHMDLMYMADPPGFQFLHCLKNNAKGGESIFSDGFNAAGRISDDDFKELVSSYIPYHYRNAGEHYYHYHNVLRISPESWRIAKHGGFRPIPQFVNYSPPFQANFNYVQDDQKKFAAVLKSLRNFVSELESPQAMYEYKLRPGECVIFNNRRVLHGRKQFEVSKGERLLKGTYVDTDAFQSRLRVLQGKAMEAKKAGKPWIIEPQYVHPEEHDIRQNEWMVRDAEEGIRNAWDQALRSPETASN